MNQVTIDGLNNIFANTVPRIMENKYHLDYKLIEDIALSYVNVETREVTSYSEINYDEMINLVLNFYRSIDENLFNKIASTLTNNPNLRIYDSRNIDISSPDVSKLKDINDWNLFERASVSTYKDDYRVNLPYDGTMKSAFSFVHELAHTLDMDNRGTEAYDIFVEQTPFIMEKMFVKYLSSTQYENDGINYLTGRISNICSSAKDAIGNIIFINTIEKNGDLTFDGIKKYVLENHKICETFNLDEKNYDEFFDNVITLSNDDKFTIKNDSRSSVKYLLAETLTPQFSSNFDLDRFEKHITTVGRVNPFNTLENLGVVFNDEGKIINNSQLFQAVNEEVKLISNTCNRTI